MRWLLILIISVTWGSSVSQAQVVMLPSFQRFEYSGSVLVPDRGSAHLGSVARGAESRQNSRWGPFRSRSSGRSMSRSTASAHVHIIDLAEMDRQLLGGTPEEFMRRQRAAESANLTPPTPVDPVEQAKQLVRDARRCVMKGNFIAADYYYRRAIGELPSDLAGIARIEYDQFLDHRAAILASKASIKRPQH